MQVEDALPVELYERAIARSQTPEWLTLRDGAIATLQQWDKDPERGPKPPALWFGYGKDGMAAFLLLKMAGIEFVTLNVDNGGDIEGHSEVLPEFDAFASCRETIWYRTEKSYIEVLSDVIEEGRSEGCDKANGSPIDFFDLGEMEEYFLWEVLNQFLGQYADGEETLYLWGNRCDEDTERASEVAQRGLLHYVSLAEDLSFWRGLPISEWSDLDVWALLVRERSPVSPVYAMHGLPQHPDHAFPRTIWYASQEMANSVSLRWLQHYSPRQYGAIRERFAEVLSLEG